MWFQDLSITISAAPKCASFPTPPSRAKISFCAYNTGVGWRQIIENMHKNATVAEWYKTHGKHEIYAKGKAVNLANFEHSLVIDANDAARVRHLEHDVPLTAAEEDRARRKKAYEEQAKVRAIYEETGPQEGSDDRCSDRFANRHQASHPGQLRQNQWRATGTNRARRSGHRKPSEAVAGD